MKKLLFVFVLGAFAACGSGENAATTTDSVPKVDSASVTVDSSAAHTDSSAAQVDSSAAKAAH
ncbi:MAG: hypothetical protein ACKO1T_10665 [Sediminibacterium sp.]